MDILFIFFFVFASCAFLTSSIHEIERKNNDKNFDYMWPDMIETDKESGDDSVPNSVTRNPEFQNAQERTRPS